MTHRLQIFFSGQPVYERYAPDEFDGVRRDLKPRSEYIEPGPFPDNTGVGAHRLDELSQIRELLPDDQKALKKNTSLFLGDGFQHYPQDTGPVIPKGLGDNHIFIFLALVIGVAVFAGE